MLLATNAATATAASVNKKQEQKKNDLLERAKRYAEIAEKNKEEQDKKREELAAQHKINAAKNGIVTLKLPSTSIHSLPSTLSNINAAKEIANKFKANLTLTDKQLEAIQLAIEGAQFCLIGAAGTGKTTTVKQMIKALFEHDKLNILKHNTKYLTAGNPAIAFVAFTNRAVNNIKKQIPDELKSHARTIHKLLEYGPVFTQVFDEVNNKVKTKMTFEPARNKLNPIIGLQYIIVEESSMVGTELFAKLKEATPGAKFIFLGDLNQIPPIYDSGILGFKLNELPVVELDKVWRQDFGGILTLAHAIKDGANLSQNKLEEFAQLINKETGVEDIELRSWPGKHGGTAITRAFVKHITEKLVDEFNPETDIMLCPLVKNFGSVEINKAFAQAFGDKRDADVWEVNAGRVTHYLAVGDKVMYEKEDYIITEIARNGQYLGKPTRAPSKHLDRWGHYSGAKTDLAPQNQLTDEEMDNAFAALANISLDSSEDFDIVNQSSHIITLRSIDDPDYETTVSTTGEMNSLDFSYCISVHKSQGSEWQKVYVVFHHSHANMLYRELVYTAVTRAREKLVIYYDKESMPLAKDGTFHKAIKNVMIKGNTLAEKAEYFKGKEGKMQQRLNLQDLFSASASSASSASASAKSNSL